MRISKQQLYTLLFVIVVSTLLAMLKLPYYIYKPGRADPLESMVELEGATSSEGDMHLVTVSGGQATPIQYIFAHFLPFYDIVPLEQVRPDNMTDEEYRHAQLQMMNSSQKVSQAVAYEAADANVTITYEGVTVAAVIESMPADGVLETGDIIKFVDDQPVETAEDLINYIEKKKADDEVTVEVERDGKLITETLGLKSFPDAPEELGIGVQLITDREVVVEPEVNFSSGSIGGPSAGLIFALKIYDLLVDEDLTRGYHIAGTGEIDFDGDVKRVGGVDKKVVAAHREGCDIFFVPYESGASGSNYEEAIETAKEIDTAMEIVPVDTFDEAVQYLEQLERKQ